MENREKRLVVSNHSNFEVMDLELGMKDLRLFVDHYNQTDSPFLGSYEDDSARLGDAIILVGKSMGQLPIEEQDTFEENVMRPARDVILKIADKLALEVSN